MPFDDIVDPSVADLYPSTKNDHTQLLARCTRLFTQAEAWRRSYEDFWSHAYKLSQSFAEREKGAWGSNVFVPITHFTIQTILPRLVASLPAPLVSPVGPEDADGAPAMEELLDWSAQQSDLYYQLVQGFDYSLRYGTGILKTTPGKRSVWRTKREQLPQDQGQMGGPVIDPETGQPLTGPDGQPFVSPGTEPTPARMKTTTTEDIYYIGPFAECIDIFDMYPDPMATGFEDASYVIQRSYKPKSWVAERVRSGFFRKPEFISDYDFKIASEAPVQQRVASVNLGGGLTEADYTEVWEMWYRDEEGITVTTVLNRRIIVRLVASPYDHGEFPYVRIVDHLNPGEFWGAGEVKHLEGIQDLVNAMTNQRVDNVRLKMNGVFYGDKESIADRRDLRIAPGSFIPVNTREQPLDQVFRPLDLGDITASAYEEVDFWLTQAQQTSGVSDYALGTDSSTLNNTATGIALISEQGNTRFSMKIKMAELTGLKALYRQYGALIQQFVPDDFIMRIQGNDGVTTFKPVEPAAIYGAFDYDIEAESSTQTESVRKQQAMEMFQLALTAVNPTDNTLVFNLDMLAKDLLRANGKKNIDEYLTPATAPMMPGAVPGAVPGQPGPQAPIQPVGPPVAGPPPGAGPPPPPVAGPPGAGPPAGPQGNGQQIPAGVG